jgi:hypothetical protein
LILANGKAPTVITTFENLFLHVEDLNDARTPLADFFNSLLLIAGVRGHAEE